MISIVDFEFEDRDCSIDDIREEIVAEIAKYHPGAERSTKQHDSFRSPCGISEQSPSITKFPTPGGRIVRIANSHKQIPRKLITCRATAFC